MTEQHLIELLKNSDEKTLKMVYLENRSAFKQFARKLSVTDEDIFDAYQDAIIILREKALTGDLDNLTCSIKTYLFGIGKHILYDKTRKNNKNITNYNFEKVSHNFQEIIEEIDENNLTIFEKSLQIGFISLGKKCKEILTLFYYRGYTIEEITEKLNYENKNVAKSQKSRCLKKLKENSNL